MEWKPDDVAVQSIVALLQEFFLSPASNQTHILQRLEAWYASYHDFPCYLAYVMVLGEGLDVTVRQSAGLLLKNHPKALKEQQSGTVLHTVISLVARGLGLEEKILRHTAATCTAMLVTIFGFEPLHLMLDAIFKGLQSEQETIVDGALNALQKIWEDSPGRLEESLASCQNKTASDVVLPLVIKIVDRPEIGLKVSAVTILNYAVYSQSSGMDELVWQYKAVLFSLASRPEASVRRVVCVGLVHLSELAPSKLEANLAELIEYMIVASQDSNAEVAIEASEFWSVFSEAGFDSKVLEPFVPKIVPLLLNNMKFDEYDEEVAEAEADEEAILSGNVREKDSELRPHLHASTSHGEQEDEEDDYQEEDAVWTLRKSAAAGLDMISNILGDDILPILLPSVQVQLQDSNWKSREAAILALGAVSNGCHTGMKDHLDTIVAAVMPGLTDLRPMIRCISCWTLTRYSRQIYNRVSEGDDRLLSMVLNGVLDRVTKDHNRIVQISACGSLATLIEEDSIQIKPYMNPICSALAHALKTYRKRSLRSVYDVVSTIALTLPEILSHKELSPIMLQSLFDKLSSFPDGDSEIFPLLDCVGTVSSALNSAISPYAENAFVKCVSLIERSFLASDTGAIDQEEAARFVEHSLDAIDGIMQGLGKHSGPLFSKSPLGTLLVRSSVDSSAVVRQSAFGLLGDLAEICMVNLIPYLSPLLESALECMKPENITGESVDACNNAVWSLGVVSKVCSEQDVAQFALVALERLLPILTAPVAALPRTLVQNAAVCLGRICETTPATLAPHAHLFLGGWCAALRGLRDGEEKTDAYEGLCRIIRANPVASADHFKGICECFASWNKSPGEPLNTEMAEITQGFRSQFMSNGQWDLILSAMNNAVRMKLRL